MTSRTIALLTACALSIGTVAGCANAAQPYTMESERAAHPNMANAIAAMQAALADMERAPDNFGGNKHAAIVDLQHAIQSAKRALYYRLQMDDAALMRLH